MTEPDAGQSGAARAQHSPIAVRLARFLFCLNGAIWVTLAILTLTRPPEPGLPALLDDTYREILFALMVLNATLMVGAGLLLGIRRRVAWYFALAVLAVNLAFTFTDEVGLADWATAALDVVLVGLLIGVRAWFAPVRQG